jgi:hypothetical protein
MIDSACTVPAASLRRSTNPRGRTVQRATGHCSHSSEGVRGPVQRVPAHATALSNIVMSPYTEPHTVRCPPQSTGPYSAYPTLARARSRGRAFRRVRRMERVERWLSRGRFWIWARLSMVLDIIRKYKINKEIYHRLAYSTVEAATRSISPSFPLHSPTSNAHSTLILAFYFLDPGRS